MARMIDRDQPRHHNARGQRRDRSDQKRALYHIANKERGQANEPWVERKKRQREPLVAGGRVSVLRNQKILRAIPAVPNRKQMGDGADPLAIGYLEGHHAEQQHDCLDHEHHRDHRPIPRGQAKDRAFAMVER